jgi:hypothetical protein
MSTVFSYIIQKHFSQANENVATDTLAYVLESSDATRRGMTKLLRGILPNLPPLRFKTQQTEGSIRPDMWGFADAEPRVFLENKFWAGLTDRQPVSYLKQLAAYPQPTVLLVVAPAAREQTLWSELSHRLLDAGISVSEHDATAGITCSVATQLGPVLALTSWTNVLSVLEHETVDDPGARGDLVQLRSLCDAADNDAFSPVSMEELSDQRTPALLLQLSSIVQGAIELAVTKGILNLKGTMPQASAERIGRYSYFGEEHRAGAWLGIHFRLWKKHGTTPLWAVLTNSDWKSAHGVQALLEPWAIQENILAIKDDDGSYVVALDIPAGEEKGTVVTAIVTRLEEIASCLADMESLEGSTMPNE